MKKPFFTIIVVSYNAGDKLLKTVESVNRQTFTDYRILVKDGMSTDGSLEKLKAAYDVSSIKDENPGKMCDYLPSFKIGREKEENKKKE